MIFNFRKKKQEKSILFEDIIIPDINFDKYINEYRKFGVVVIPKIFTTEEIYSLRLASMVSLTKLEDITKDGYKHPPLEISKGKNGPAPSLLFWPSLASKEMNSFRIHSKLSSIVKAFLGENVKQLNNQFYYRFPGDGDSFAWHQDIMFRKPLDRYPLIVENDAYLQTSIVVDNISEENSAVEYILGSHNLGNLNLDEKPNWKGLRGFNRENISDSLKQLPSRKVSANSGDIVLWSSLIVHGSEKNVSSQSRMYYMNGFANADNCMDWPWYLKDGRVAKLNSKLIP